jgi:hypothetical protein
MTAQTAAGIQPSKVICRIRQIIPVNILPRRKKDSQGSSMAIKVMIQDLKTNIVLQININKKIVPI